MSFLRAAALAAPLALAPLAAAAQTVAVPDRVPDGIKIMVSVSDSPAVWSAYSATSLAANIRAIAALPEVQTNPDIQEATLEMDKAELELGFSVHPAKLFGEVLQGFDFYVVRPDAQAEPSVLLLSRFRDAANAAKLADYIKARAAQESQDAVAAGGAPVAWQTTSIEGVDVFSAESEGIHYAVMGDVFMIGSMQATLRDSISSTGVSRLAANPRLASSFAKVPRKEGQISFFFDGAEAASIARQAGSGPIDMSWMPKGSTSGTIDATPQAFGLSYYTALDNPSEAQRQLFSIPPASLAPMLGYVSARPLFSSVNNLLDGPALARLTEEQVGASGQDAAARIAAVRTQIEATTGLSLDNEILPAFGPDMAVAVNGIDFANMFAPSADALIALRIRDKAKAEAVIGKFEARMLENLTAQARAMNPSAPAVQPTLSQQGSVTMRSIPLGGPGMPIPLSLTHAVTADGVWLVGLGEISVRGAIMRQTDGESLSTVVAQASGANLIPAKFNNIGLVNFEAVGGTITQVLPLVAGMMGGGQQDMTTPNQIVRTIASLGVGYIATANDGTGTAGYGRLVPTAN